MSSAGSYSTWLDPRYSGVPVGSGASSTDGYYSAAVSPRNSEAGSVFSGGSADTHMTVPPHPSFAGIDGEYRHLGTGEMMPCEFQALMGCTQYFRIDQRDDWIVHHIQDHLKQNYPSRVRCPLCDQFLFDARARRTSPEINFWDRMKHWASHYEYGENVGPPRVDHHMVEYIGRLGLINSSHYQGLMQESEMPAGFREAVASGARPRGFVTERERRHRRRENEVMINPAAEDREIRRHRPRHR